MDYLPNSRQVPAPSDNATRPLTAVNTGVDLITDPDRLDELRAKYERLRADRSAPHPLKRYARLVLAEIRVAGERRAA